jgi:lipid II:glycine glycyltransferase (peptidoglycan interpeptide bridge formation enzyme)
LAVAIRISLRPAVLYCSARFLSDGVIILAKLDTIWSSALSPADGEAYDQFVAGAGGGHYSQARSWAKLATAGKPLAARYFLARRDGRAVGAALLLRVSPSSFLPLPVAHSERGPVCDDPDDLPEILRALAVQARRHGILRLSVMPYWADQAKQAVEASLARCGFSDVQSFAGRHARTLRLDLRALSRDNPFAGSALAKVRQNIGRAQRAGATVRRGEKRDLAAFRDMHEHLLRAERRRLPSPDWYEAVADYYLSDHGAMFVCEHQAETVAAIFVARHGDLATYVMGASSPHDVGFPKMVLPLATAITSARDDGVNGFDLGGCPMAGDDDAKRASIAEFKRSFSRTEIALVHEHRRWF